MKKPRIDRAPGNLRRMERSCAKSVSRSDEPRFVPDNARQSAKMVLAAKVLKGQQFLHHEKYTQQKTGDRKHARCTPENPIATE